MRLRVGARNDDNVKLYTRRRKMESNIILLTKSNQSSGRNCEICGDNIAGNKAPSVCEKCKADYMRVLTYLTKGQGEAPEISGFRSIKMLGRGGLGMAWLVEEEATGMQMVLKLMLPKAVVDQKRHDLFVREAMVTGQLKHPNIIRQHKFGKSGDAYFLLMEYCNGGNVNELINKSGGKLRINLATDIILQVLDGMIYAHNTPHTAKMKNGELVSVTGIVHRDFKPSNILLCNDGQKLVAKVADFGLAKAFEISGLSGDTRSGMVAGTPFFIPHQQVLNYKYAKPDVDVWAIAATYYYMLTGTYPKDFVMGRNAFKTALNSAAVPIRERNDNIPLKLANAIDIALIEKPQIGIQNAIELKKMIMEARCTVCDTQKIGLIEVDLPKPEPRPEPADQVAYFDIPTPGTGVPLHQVKQKQKMKFWFITIKCSPLMMALKFFFYTISKRLWRHRHNESEARK